MIHQNSPHHENFLFKYVVEFSSSRALTYYMLMLKHVRISMRGKSLGTRLAKFVVWLLYSVQVHLYMYVHVNSFVCIGYYLSCLPPYLYMYMYMYMCYTHVHVYTLYM